MFLPPNTLLSDVIFPAPSAAYFVNLWIPFSLIFAMAAVFGVYVYYQRGIMPLWKLLGLVLGVNVISWIIGLLSTFLFPSFLVPHLVNGPGHVSIIEPGPYWNLVATLSFGWACLLSTILEYLTLWRYRKRLEFRKLGLCVTVANVFGYILIMATVWTFLHFNLV